jgi:thiol-disulfide isomerase/thioredoxin
MKKTLFSAVTSATLAVMFVFQPGVPPASAAEGQLDLSAYQGKLVYLDFWASWCAPCRRSFPWMNQMLARYGERGFAIVSVNVDTEQELAEKFLSETPASFPVVYDPDGTIAARWELLGMPSSFLIGPNGEVISRHVGFRSDSLETYEAEIRRLLNIGELQ